MEAALPSQQIVADTFSALTAIQAGILVASNDVSIYVQNHDRATILLSIVSAVFHDRLAQLLKAMEGGFTEFNWQSFRRGDFSKEQGIYSVFTFLPGHAYKAYVGSGVGREGLLRRILDHLNPEFRKRNASKYLYRILENPEVTAHYLTLASFSTAVSPAVYYLTEATIALILGTYSSDVYKVIRLPGIPRVDWKRGMKMADPLITNDQVRLWKELAVSRRTYTLSNAISGGTTTVYAGFKANGSLNTVEFYLCRLKFLITLAIAREWTLTSSPTVNVDY